MEKIQPAGSLLKTLVSAVCSSAPFHWHCIECSGIGSRLKGVVVLIPRFQFFGGRECEGYGTPMRTTSG